MSSSINSVASYCSLNSTGYSPTLNELRKADLQQERKASQNEIFKTQIEGLTIKIDSWASEDEEVAEALLNRAEILLDLGRVEEALADYKEVKKKYPEFDKADRGIDKCNRHLHPMKPPSVSNEPSSSSRAPRQVSTNGQLRKLELKKLRTAFIETHGLADLYKSNVSEERASELQQRLYHLTNIRTEQSSTLKAFKRTVPPIVHPLTIFE